MFKVYTTEKQHFKLWVKCVR